MSPKNQINNSTKTEDPNTNSTTHMNSPIYNNIKTVIDNNNKFNINFDYNNRRTFGQDSSDVEKKKHVKFKDNIDISVVESYKTYNIMEINVYDSIDVRDKCYWQCQCTIV